MKVKRDDKVKVIAGNHKGKEGVVQAVNNDKKKIIVEGINVVKKHVKPNQMNPNGGIIEKEAFIDASNVMLVCSHCNKAVKTSKNRENGTVARVCKSCNKPV